MSIVKINQRGNISIPRNVIQPLITFEKGKEFRVMTGEEYNKIPPEERKSGAIVLMPLKGLTEKDYDIPF
jgi:hypothetical protein